MARRTNSNGPKYFHPNTVYSSVLKPCNELELSKYNKKQTKYSTGDKMLPYQNIAV